MCDKDYTLYTRPLKVKMKQFSLHITFLLLLCTFYVFFLHIFEDDRYIGHHLKKTFKYSDLYSL